MEWKVPLINESHISTSLTNNNLGILGEVGRKEIRESKDIQL